MKHPAASCGVSGEILRSRYPPSPQPSPRFRWAAEASAKAARLRRVLPSSSPSKLRCIRGRRIKERECRSSSQRGGIGQVVANGIVADGRTVLLDAEPRDIGGCGAGDSHLFQGPILTGSDRHGGRGVSPMCRRWSNSRIATRGSGNRGCALAF